MLRIMMLLANARSDVMFAHYAVRRNIIHAVNITAEGNITCPQGQTSFSVNAPLRASRYRVISLAENLQLDKSASIAFDWSNAEWAKPKPL